MIVFKPDSGLRRQPHISVSQPLSRLFKVFLPVRPQMGGHGNAPMMPALRKGPSSDAGYAIGEVYKKDILASAKREGPDACHP